jgi:hypothetical protein
LGNAPSAFGHAPFRVFKEFFEDMPLHGESPC